VLLGILSAVLIKSMGEDAPFFDIVAYHLPNDSLDLLVNIEIFECALAKTVLIPVHNASATSTTELDL